MCLVGIICSLSPIEEHHLGDNARPVFEWIAGECLGLVLGSLANWERYILSLFFVV